MQYAICDIITLAALSPCPIRAPPRAFTEG